MNEQQCSYNSQDRQSLLDVARQSILHGIELGTQLMVDPSQYSEALQAERATFVTLRINDELRGCIGSLVATESLVSDVAHNAFSAAFRDPRFGPLTRDEFDHIHISISVLTPPEPLAFSSEQDLLQKIRPGVDGLVISDGLHRGTFLPAVWEQLPDPKEFLAHLKLKAHLSPDYWSDSIKVERYTTESIE